MKGGLSGAPVRALTLAAAGVLAVAALASCFPDYGIAPGSSDGGAHEAAPGDGAASGEASPGQDATTGDAGKSDGASGDAATGDSAAGDASPGDGAATDGSASEAGDSSTPPPDSGVVDDTVAIAPGTYTFTVQNADGGTVTASATLDYTLHIDRTEQTVGHFQSWVAAGKPHPASAATLDPKYLSMTWDASWNTDVANTDFSNGSVCNQPGGKGPTYGLADPSLPMNCVPWAQALAFCWWDHGRRLVTDTEWRIAATSEGQRTPYPWGSASPTCALAIFDNGTAKCGWPVDAGTTPGGATLDGVDDLVGSLSEWLWDFLPAAYAYPASPGTDYPGPAASGANSRIWIGGDYSQDGTALYVYQSGPVDSSPSENFDNTGFRCASSQ